MIVSDGIDVAVLVNADLAAAKGPAWARGVANTLLARCASGERELRAVG